MKYNRFHLKIYRKFHKIIKKSQLRLTCSDKLRLFYLTITAWTYPETGQVGGFIFPAASLRGHVNCRKWIRRRKILSLRFLSAYKFNTAPHCQFSPGILKIIFGHPECFQHFARTISGRLIRRRGGMESKHPLLSAVKSLEEPAREIIVRQYC